MTRSDAIEAVLAHAHAAVGISEEPRGSNDGPELRRFLAGTGFEPGQAWCAYFVQAIGQRALASSQGLVVGEVDAAARSVRLTRAPAG